MLVQGMVAALLVTASAWACLPPDRPPIVEPTQSTINASPTPTQTVAPAQSPSPVALPTPDPGLSPAPSATPMPNIFALPISAPTPTLAPAATETVIPTPIPAPTATAIHTATPLPTPLPLDLQGSSSSPTKIELRWTLTFDDVEQFSLFRDEVLIATPSTDERSYSDINLSPNTRYAYRLELSRTNGSTLSADLGKATLAAVPRISRQMATHRSGLQLPIIDEVNPDYTEYQVTLYSTGAGGVSSSTWSADRCRAIEGLEPGGNYTLAVEARNLDGVTTRAVNHFAEDGGPAIVRERIVHALGHSGTQDPWVTARIVDVAAVHGLTEAAEDWMNNDIFIKWHRGEPGLRSYHQGQVGFGYSNVGWLMQQVMPAFWEYWDGFPESCDQMNLYTFRRDVAQFALDFWALERSGPNHHLAPWRPYYNLIVAILALQDLAEEDYWDVLERGEYGRFGLLWYELETTIPGFNPHHPSLIPPHFRKYFDGFMRGGESRTWEEEFDWYTSLEDEDRGLWFPLVTHAILHNSPRGPTSGPRTRIPEPLRTTLRNADRQMLVEFINTMEDHTPWEWWVDSPGFWRIYLQVHLHRLPLYKSELDSSMGVELAESNLNAVLRALQLVYDFNCGLGVLNCGLGYPNTDTSANQVGEAIARIEPLSAAQRSILMAMVDLGNS